MATSEDVLRVARSQIGVDSGRKYFEEMGDSYWGQAWCARFGRWSYWKVGADIHWPYDYAFDERDVPRDYRVGKYDLQPADSLCFDWNDDAKGDHYGIVESVQDWGCVTIEGNTAGGRVARQHRLWSVIICGLRPTLDRGKLYVDGVAGYLTIMEWQSQCKTTQDGSIQDQPDYLDKYRSNVIAIQHGSGDYGSELIKAVQRKCGLTGRAVDGVWGMETSKAIQRKLKAWGYYYGEIDGYFGRMSVIALQQSLNDEKWKA